MLIHIFIIYLTDFLKKNTCEVKAFLKALQFYRQEKGQYESWDMLIGSDVRVGTLISSVLIKFTA